MNPSKFKFIPFAFFLLPIFLGLCAAEMNMTNGTFYYSKDGNLEHSFVYTGNLTQSQIVGSAQFHPILFFIEEKENRQVFNLDVCADFPDRNGSMTNYSNLVLSKKTPPPFVLICYDALLGGKNLEKARNNSADRMTQNQTAAQNIVDKYCQEDKRGILITFKPPNYDIYTSVDYRGYTVYTADFVEDEVKVYRKNKVAMHCLRLEMGRMPPDMGDVIDQQEQVQDAIRYILFDAEAKNKTDNMTDLLRDYQKITLKVEDLTQDVVLKTVDLMAHEDAYAYGTQKDRISKRLLGVMWNKTEEDDPKKYPFENRTREFFISQWLYRDMIPKLKTDKNFKKPTWLELAKLDIFYAKLHHVNFSFNGGNVFPCRSEWVELEKFQMERDFYHVEIHRFFSPINIAYTVGLVGWKKEEEKGFGPGYKKKGKFGPSDEEIEQLKQVLPKTKGFMDMEQRYLLKFGSVEMLPNGTFSQLDDYFTPLQLYNQTPLGEITVKQLVFVCADYTFNMPHVASFVEGIGL